MAKQGKKQVGRPAGTRNSDPVVVIVVPPACPDCGGTARVVVRIIREREIQGKAPNGQLRTHVVWRRVQCSRCDRYFIEVSHENHPAEGADDAISEETIGIPDC